MVSSVNLTLNEWANRLQEVVKSHQPGYKDGRKYLYWHWSQGDNQNFTYFIGRERPVGFEKIPLDKIHEFSRKLIVRAAIRLVENEKDDKLQSSFKEDVRIISSNVLHLVQERVDKESKIHRIALRALAYVGALFLCLFCIFKPFRMLRENDKNLKNLVNEVSLSPDIIISTNLIDTSEIPVSRMRVDNLQRSPEIIHSIYKKRVEKFREFYKSFKEKYIKEKGNNRDPSFDEVFHWYISSHFLQKGLTDSFKVHNNQANVNVNAHAFLIDANRGTIFTREDGILKDKRPIIPPYSNPKNDESIPKSDEAMRKHQLENDEAMRKHQIEKLDELIKTPADQRWRIPIQLVVTQLILGAPAAHELMISSSLVDDHQLKFKLKGFDTMPNEFPNCHYPINLKINRNELGNISSVDVENSSDIDLVSLDEQQVLQERIFSHTVTFRMTLDANGSPIVSNVVYV